MGVRALDERVMPQSSFGHSETNNFHCEQACHALCCCESQGVTANVAAHRLFTSKPTIFIVTSLPCFVKIVEVVSFCVTCHDPHDPETEMTDPHANFSR